MVLSAIFSFEPLNHRSWYIKNIIQKILNKVGMIQSTKTSIALDRRATKAETIHHRSVTSTLVCEYDRQIPAAIFKR